MKLAYTVSVPALTGLRYFTGIVAIVAIFISLGCASGMSKEECQHADWELIGYGDGSKGYSSSLIDRHRKDCAGISSPNLSLYLQGHQRGLISFCTEINGYQSGKRGAGLNSACSGINGDQFHGGYDFGRRLFMASVEIKRLIKHLTDTKQQRVDIEQRLIELESDLLRPGISAARRADLLLRIKRKRDRISELDDKIVFQERKLRKSLGRLNALNKNNPYEDIPEQGMPDIQVRASKHDQHREQQENHGQNVKPRISIETTP